MRDFLIILAIAFFVGVAFFVNQSRHQHSKAPHRHETKEAASKCAGCREKEAKRSIDELRSIHYLERYVEDVINHGSSQNLGFKYGDMPAHMADERAAPKIAAYVVTLSGKKPTHPEWAREGHTFYISNCGGCHGEDGRGIHGTFPDLTRDPLLGIERRIRRLMVTQRR
ncbi:c-type cytochrome [Hydrogenimonas urashimensis]|uniref:c-type cytochrome n=1 Tax=Hydrogenimonas urashimensis TaxID=2740515 RepID=UPI0019160488|nr:c-type cytochrome [Hydrogenimonas urashimensis]